MNMSNKAVEESILRFTIHVMYNLFQQPRFWIGAAAIILMLSISGPFNTSNSMTFPERLAFWLLIASSTFGVGFFISLYFGEWFQQLGVGEIIARILAGLMSGVPIALIVWLVGLFIFDFNAGRDFTNLAILIGQCALIAAAISLLFLLFMKKDEQLHNLTVDKMSEDNLFLQRLSVELGNDLVSVQAQDHYLKVTTNKGSEMLLMRMGDACSELEAIDGMQVHRSWWVASGHVTGTTKNNSRVVLNLSDGQEVPVSRGFLKQVQKRFGS